MGVLGDLRNQITGSSQQPAKKCEDEFIHSGLLTVTTLAHGANNCELSRQADQRIGFAMTKLGKSAVVHAKAKPHTGILLVSQQWQADIGVNLRGAKYPDRVFAIEPDPTVDVDEAVLEIEVWRTNSKVKHTIAHDDIPNAPDSSYIDTLNVEYDIP